MSYNDIPLTIESVKKGIEATDNFISNIVKKKYAHGDEQNIHDVRARMSKTVVEALDPKLKEALPSIAKDINKAINEGYFIPGGSIMDGLGALTDRKGSLSNCYVVGIENDSIESIGKVLTEMMRTYSYRGGCGTDITVLRPDGAVCHNAASSSSGAVSFLPMLSMVTRTIGQNNRRGACLVSIDVTHPDVMSFIWSKADTKSVIYSDHMDREVPNINRVNISVQLTDEFMQAVIDDKPWVCKFPNLDDMEFYNKHWTGDYEKYVAAGGKLKEYYSYTAFVHEGNKERFIGQQIIVTNDDPLTKLDYAMQIIDDSTVAIYVDEIIASKLHVEGNHVTKREFLYPSARKILMEISKASLMRADPGVMFSGTAHRDSWTEVIDPCLKIVTTNPCGEIQLSSGGACNLGSLTLSKFVKNPWTTKAYFDYNEFANMVRTSVVIMDTICSINHPLHPLDKQRKMDENSRRIGIEFHSLADALSMLGTKYDSSKNCLETIENIMQVKAFTEFTISIMLAKGLGAFPLLYLESGKLKKKVLKNILEHPFVSNILNQKTAERVAELTSNIYEQKPVLVTNVAYLKDTFMMHGIRNASLSTVGPTGSISIVSDNSSSGIEPVFAALSVRSTRVGDGGDFSIVHNPSFRDLLSKMESGEIKEGITVGEYLEKYNIVEAHELDYHARVKIQSTVQKYIDNSISSTVNLPQGSTVEDIFNVYLEAYHAGCKGITVYVDKTLDGVINTIDNSPKVIEGSLEEQTGDFVPLDKNGDIYIKPIPKEATSALHVVKWNNINIYITVCFGDDSKPVSIFSTTPRDLGLDANGIYDEALYRSRVQQWELATRLSSLALRSYTPIERIVKQLDAAATAINDPIACLSRILKKYIKVELDVNTSDIEEVKSSDMSSICPECKQKTYINQGGCGNCFNPECGYTKCS